MRSHRTDGHPQSVGDLVVRTLLLMIKDQDGSLDLAETLQLFFDRLRKLPLFNLLLGVAVRVSETVLPSGSVIRQRNMGIPIAPPPLPLVLSNVDRDPVQIRRNQSLAAKARQRTIEPEKHILRQIVKMLLAACKAQKGSEDHILVVAYHLLEGEVSAQAGLDLRVRLKFHANK